MAVIQISGYCCCGGCICCMTNELIGEPTTCSTIRVTTGETYGDDCPINLEGSYDMEIGGDFPSEEDPLMYTDSDMQCSWLYPVGPSSPDAYIANFELRCGDYCVFIADPDVPTSDEGCPDAIPGEGWYELRGGNILQAIVVAPSCVEGRDPIQIGEYFTVNDDVRAPGHPDKPYAYFNCCEMEYCASFDSFYLSLPEDEQCYTYPNCVFSPISMIGLCEGCSSKNEDSATKRAFLAIYSHYGHL